MKNKCMAKMVLGILWLILLSCTPLIAQTRYRAVILSQYTTVAYDVDGNRQVGWSLQALLWFGTPESMIVIHPPRTMGFYWSAARGVSEDQIVGWGTIDPDGGISHALLWIGTPIPDQVIDLHPPGFFRSQAASVWNGKQVGWGDGLGRQALLWSGSAQSVVFLHPPGFGESEAWDIWNGQVVGWGSVPYVRSEALLWILEDQNWQVVSLHPAHIGFWSSRAYGIGDGQQVGVGWIGEEAHALLWSGSAQNVVDLHPFHLGLAHSVAIKVAGGKQAGYGGDANWNYPRALVWAGTAESAIDLQRFLPPSYNRSYAYGIDSQGQVVGRAYESIQQRWHAVLWNPLPIGDVNGDGCVNEEDVRLVLTDFGRVESGLLTDVNSDDIVNDRDLAIVLVRFGQGC